MQQRSQNVREDVRAMWPVLGVMLSPTNVRDGPILKGRLCMQAQKAGCCRHSGSVQRCICVPEECQRAGSALAWVSGTGNPVLPKP